jgi:phosphoribosylaminoimidazole-succinocarboxamide synthase
MQSTFDSIHCTCQRADLDGSHVKASCAPAINLCCTAQVGPRTDDYSITHTQIQHAAQMYDKAGDKPQHEKHAPQNSSSDTTKSFCSGNRTTRQMRVQIPPYALICREQAVGSQHQDCGQLHGTEMQQSVITQHQHALQINDPFFGYTRSTDTTIRAIYKIG